MSDTKRSQDAVVIERSFDAPADLIWQMWTDPKHLKEVDVWLEQFRRLWQESYERLDGVLSKMKKKEEKKHGRKDK